MTTTFTDLGVDERFVQRLATRGITTAFPIQEIALPMALGGADVIGQARTGTGKTLAFGLPLLQSVRPDDGVVQALVIVPTRELCIQVATDLIEVGTAAGVRVAQIYGGVPLEPQERALRERRVDVAVGTPGRLLDHVRRHNLDLSHVSTLVLDEADEMLDLGFLPDVEQLIESCSTERQTMLFSATMPSAVVALARRYMTSPTFLRAEMEQAQVAPLTQQHFFLTHRLDKPRLLARLLQAPERGLAVVFVRTKRMADRLVEDLIELGVKASAIHGDLRQASRERNLDQFRKGNTDVLIATEVAARGLDIEGTTHVINYDCPDDEKMYLHRIGRTGRAGAAGVAITLAGSDEVERLNMIRKALGAGDEPLEEVFSTSASIRATFDLPEDTPWSHLSKGRRQTTRHHERPSSAAVTAPAAATSTDAPPATEVAPSPRARRTSRRGRGTSATTTAVTTVDVTADAAQGNAEADATPAPTTRTRERSRVRSTGSETPTPSPRMRTGGDEPSGQRSASRSRSHREDGDSPAASGRSRRGGSGRTRTSGSSSTGRRTPAVTPATDAAGPGVEHAEPGRPARGGGRPAHARSVKVEHIP